MMTELKNELNRVNNLGTTENGAVGFKSTSKDLLDLNFRIPSMRGGLGTNDVRQFENALLDNLEYAVKWLFFVRDIRGGLGERDSFVKLYNVYFGGFPKEATATLSLIGEYGRWKDLVDLTFESGDDQLKAEGLKLIEKQLREDITNFTNGKSISLLAKWLPSINASSKARKQALDIIKVLGMSNGAYRKMLSKLRAHLDVTERKTCANEWDEIDYNKVSSNANLRYSSAFLKHDENRRRKYLEDLLNPNSETKVKMNATVLYPHEIWQKYTNGDGGYRWSRRNVVLDNGLEAMWQNLKDMGETGNTLCVVDGSGSMQSYVPNSKVEAISVSRALGVYFAERCTGEFHDKFIEFSSNPQIIDFAGKTTLADKINYVQQFDDCSNTDIEKVFRLILSTAVRNNMSQEDMPERILIVSDMEFDTATGHGYWNSNKFNWVPLFESLRQEYAEKGYKLPRLVFWNVNSRTNTIPVMENEAGVALISGFSTNLVKMVMSNETDPWLILKETLDSDRYKPVGDILNSIKE